MKYVRLLGCFLVLAMLAACSSGPRDTASGKTSRYLSHARGDYKPPGPPEDPWGPYIRQASSRFDMPETWIRAVMRQESGGRLFRSNGDLITSSAGAMGLMQVMPGTYDELRARYDLGDDPFEPHDNIMAGVGYMREMYDIYGSPGFLAAYNAGPGRLDDYLTNTRGLPDETRRYVSMISPNLGSDQPRTRSPAEQYAMNTLPTRIPPGLRYGRGAVQLAAGRSYGGGGRIPTARPVEVAQLPDPTPAPAPRYAAAPPPPAPEHQGGGMRLIAPAMAAGSLAQRHSGPSGGDWAIQVGAFSQHNQARAAIGQARGRARAELAVGRDFVGSVRQGHSLLYRARLTGLSKDTAVQACEKVAQGRMQCVVLSPDAQS